MSFTNKIKELDIDVIVERKREEILARFRDGVFKLHSNMEDRIFRDLKDAKGSGPAAYDTDPMYISESNWPAGVRRAGVPTKSGKSRYFADGYAQLKSEIGRPNLELTGELHTNFATGLREVSETEIHVVVEKKNSAKIEKHFQRFFIPSESEIKELKKDLGGR